MVLRSRREGFTLVELMVVVAIIGISVLAFAPSISRAFAEREVSFTTREVLRMAKRARAEALGYRRAYLLWVQPSASDDVSPVVQLIRASTSSCVAQPWTTMQEPDSRAIVENHNFNDGNEAFGTRGFNVRMVEEAMDGTTSSMNRAICWAPDGTVYTERVGTLQTGSLTTESATNTVNGAIVFRFSLFQDGAEIGTPHRLMIPLGGSPMVVP